MPNRVSAVQIQFVIQYFITTRHKKINDSSAAIPWLHFTCQYGFAFKRKRDNRKENLLKPELTLIKLSNLSNFQNSRFDEEHNICHQQLILKHFEKKALICSDKLWTMCNSQRLFSPQWFALLWSHFRDSVSRIVFLIFNVLTETAKSLCKWGTKNLDRVLRVRVNSHSLVGVLFSNVQSLT